MINRICTCIDTPLFYAVELNFKIGSNFILNIESIYKKVHYFAGILVRSKKL